jgi:hypothetical protein
MGSASGLRTRSDNELAGVEVVNVSKVIIFPRGSRIHRTMVSLLVVRCDYYATECNIKWIFGANVPIVLMHIKATILSSVITQTSVIASVATFPRCCVVYVLHRCARRAL